MKSLYNNLSLFIFHLGGNMHDTKDNKYKIQFILVNQTKFGIIFWLFMLTNY